MQHRPNVKAKTINLLEECVGKNFSGLGFGKDFLNMIQKARDNRK